MGKEIKGEGLIGLTRGFLYAGTTRVIASLWSVQGKTIDFKKMFFSTKSQNTKENLDSIYETVLHHHR